MKCRYGLLILLGMLLQFSAKSQDGWILKKNKNGIQVFSRKTSAFKFNELKVDCEFDCSISQLAAVILDVNNQYTWVYKTTKSQLLREASPSELFSYTEIQCPWPFENRDMVVHTVVMQDPETKVMTIVAKNVDGYEPDKNDIVRVKYSSALWTVTPESNNRVKIEYSIQIDPGDGVPAWLLNLFATNGPYESFLNLKEKIKLPQYAQAKFSFLLN